MKQKSLCDEDVLEVYLSGKLCERFNLDRTEFSQRFSKPVDFVNDLIKHRKLYENSVWKRGQAPPVIKMSPFAFGFDNRESELFNYEFTNRFEGLADQIRGLETHPTSS